jgi:hypothetical protein
MEEYFRIGIFFSFVDFWFIFFLIPNISNTANWFYTFANWLFWPLQMPISMINWFRFIKSVWFPK